MPGTVETYLPPPLAEASGSHRVRVLGREVFVERHGGVSYARFGMRGPASVEIEVAASIGSWVVFPEERVLSAAVSGSVLTVQLASPESVVVWIDQLEKLFLLPDPPEDNAPDPGSPGMLQVTDFGADPTGSRLATHELQAAIDSATLRPGGGTVILPRGVFRTGTLTLRSNVTLYLARGALLLGSRDPSDYPIDPGRHESGPDARLPADVRYLGRTMTFSRLLLVDRAHDVQICGRGTIDGEGTFLRTQRNAVPNLLRVRESHRVSVRDVLFRNSAAWSLHVLSCRDVDLRNVKILNDRANLNTDGIDIDMSSNVTIERSFIHTKDDAICVKATRNGDLSGDVTGVRAAGNLVSSLDAALKLGTESEAGSFTDVAFEDNFVFDSGRAMSVVVRDGATYRRVAFRRIHVGPNVDHLVEQVIGVRDPEAALGAIRDLTFEDVTAPTFTRPAGNWTWYAQFRPGRPGPEAAVNVFEGADETHAVDGLTLRRFVVNGQHLGDAATAASVANLTVGPHVRNVTFE